MNDFADVRMMMSQIGCSNGLQVASGEEYRAEEAAGLFRCWKISTCQARTRGVLVNNTAGFDRLDNSKLWVTPSCFALG